MIFTRNSCCVWINFQYDFFCFSSYFMLFFVISRDHCQALHVFLFFNIILSHEQTYSDIIVTKYMFTASNGNEKKFTSSFSARCSKSYMLWKKYEITMTINVINKSKIHFSALNRVQTYFIFIFYYKESSMTECIAWGSNNFNFVKHQNVCFFVFWFLRFSFVSLCSELSIKTTRNWWKITSEAVQKIKKTNKRNHECKRGALYCHTLQCSKAS